MSKILFSQAAIIMLKQHNEVTYVSEKSISFTSEFRVEIATCKTKYDVIELFKSVGIDPTMFGNKGLNSLYDRYKSQYRNKGAAAFTSESRGQKNFKIRKPMIL